VDGVLASLAEGLRVVSLLLRPYLPVSTDKLLDVLGVSDRGLAAARFGAGTGQPRRFGAIEPLFPKL
jgi:methionyl-tRNA synthetase